MIDSIVNTFFAVKYFDDYLIIFEADSRRLFRRSIDSIFFSFLSFLNVFFSQRKHTSQFNSWLILESGTNDSVIHVVCPGSTAVGSDIE